jgi:hypothetical protein
MRLQRTSARLAASAGIDERSVPMRADDTMLRRRMTAIVGDKGVPGAFESGNCNGFPR